MALRRGTASRGRRPRPSLVSVENRRQVAADRFVVEADGHQGGLIRDAKFLPEAPAHQFAVTRRHEKTRSLEHRSSPDECLQVLVGLADRVARPTDACGVAGDPAEVLDHVRGALRYRVAEIAIAVMTVDCST